MRRALLAFKENYTMLLLEFRVVDYSGSVVLGVLMHSVILIKHGAVNLFRGISSLSRIVVAALIF